MKKYFALIGAAVLIVALSAPAMAQDWTKGFKSTSLFQIWTGWIQKQEFNNGGTAATTDDDKDRNTRYIGSRINFYLEYGDAKFARGVIGFEADSTNWGESSYTAGEFGSGSANRMGVGSADQVQLEIKHAYVDFVIPNTPLSVTAGIQGFAYGGRLFQSRDIPGLKLTANFAPHQVQAFWWRENETDRTTYQVNDTYGLQYSLAQKLFNVTAFAAYKNDLRSATYSDHPYWIGVGGGFRPGNLNLSGQLIYLGGTRDYVTASDVDYKAWAAEILAQYQIGPGMSVAVEGFYATGNDADKTDEYNIYQRPTGSESHANFGLGRTVFFWMNFSEFGNQHNKQSDFGGMYYGRVNFNYSPLAWLNLSFNYLYIGDTSKGTDGLSGINSPVGARTDKDEDFIGHEINLITKFRIYNNLTYNIGVGYFIPGAVYDQPGKDADAAYAVNTGMQLAF